MGGNEHIYFYPNGVQSDSEHSVVVVENTTSYKINHLLGQKKKKKINAHVNKRPEYSEKLNSFANGSQWVSISPHFFVTGRKNSRTKSILGALMSPQVLCCLEHTI